LKEVVNEVKLIGWPENRLRIAPNCQRSVNRVQPSGAAVQEAFVGAEGKLERSVGLENVGSMKRHETLIEMPVPSVAVAEGINQRITVAGMFTDRTAPRVIALQRPTIGEALVQFNLRGVIGRVRKVCGDASLIELRIAYNQVLRRVRAAQQAAADARDVRGVQIVCKAANIVVGEGTAGVGVEPYIAENGNMEAAVREASELWGELTSGQWKVRTATLETYLTDLQTIAPGLQLPEDWSERMMLASTAEWASQQESSEGRVARNIEGQTVFVSWEKDGALWTAALIAPSTWRTLWRKLELDAGVLLNVTGPEGNVLHGSARTHGPAAYRAAAMSGLPWNITITPAADAALLENWTARRRFLIAGMAVFALVLALGSFPIARAMKRELAVARLQSDFVSAVSHEFRTPLTSIRQLTEMLARGRMETEQDKYRAYELMLGQSDRLRRLVESLLDFGRMQAGEFRFRSENIDAAQCFRSVAEEFQETVRGRGYAVEFKGCGEDVRISGDREALGGALAAWSAAGKSLFFRRFVGDAPLREVSRISIEDGASRQLGLDFAVGRSPHIHPDGRQVAFTTIGQPQLEVWAFENLVPPNK
jgi:signal transduction histidine kinase